MGKDDFGPISQYNSLIDPNLQGYYSKSIVRHHLRQTGLINKKGEIIPEDVWRKKIHTKERMEQASRLIASKIVQQAIEIKNLEKAEIRRKLEEVSKRELVKRIRGKSLQNRQLPLLWSNKDDSYSLDYQNKRNQSRSISPKNDEYDDIKVVEDDQDIDHRVFVPRPPKQKPLKKIRFRRRAGAYLRGVSATASKPEPVIITMIYYGKGIKIPFDTQVFESKDEITIYQQHCGGENLIVYSGLHEKGDKFSFQSKRHKEFPFGLTIFLNGRYDSRISTCCEYRHNQNVRIGINGSFGMTSVVGDHPCVKCLWEKNQRPQRAKSSKLPEDNSFKKKEPVEEEEEESDEEIDVKVEKTPILPANTDDYEDEFNDGSDEWIIKVYTSDLKNKLFEGTNANVYITLIGAKNETEKFWLDKSKVKSKNKNLFEAGNIDEFLVTSNIELDKLHQIRIGHDNTGFNSGWHLEKVEVINKNDNTLYLFLCNRWLSKDEDDGRIELVLPEPKDKIKENVKLKIEMKHDEPIIKKRTPTPVRSPSPVVQRTPSPKLRTPSPESITESSRSPSPVQDNSRRLTSNDLIKIVKEEEVVSVRSNQSRSSAVSSKSKSSKSSRPASQKSKKSSSKKSDSSDESSSSSSSESDQTEKNSEVYKSDEESSDREYKSIYQQVKENEERLFNYNVDVDVRKSREELNEEKKSPSIKKSRENSNESKRSNGKKSTSSKESSVRGESRNSNHSVHKELVSESKNSLASSSRSVPKELVSESKNSLVSSSRSELHKNSTLKETKSESGRSSSSAKSKQIEKTVANISSTNLNKSNSKINDNLSVKSASRKSSETSLNKETEVARLSSKHLEVSRASSKAESVLKQKSSSDSDDSDSSDSTAKEEADEELAKVSKASSRLSNQSLNELAQAKRNSVNPTPNNKNGNNINLIQELIVKNDSKTGSRTSLNSKDKVLESASNSHLSNKNNEINSSKTNVNGNVPVIPKVNIIGTSDLEESSKSSFKEKKSLSSEKSNSVANRSNNSLGKKDISAHEAESNQDDDSDESDDSNDNDTDSESQEKKRKPVGQSNP